MADKTKHQGFTNYATWSVDLMLQNEKQYYEKAKKLAKEDLTIHQLADALEEYVHEEMKRGLGEWQTDLMNNTLSDVNWKEIAEEVKEGFE